MQYNPPMPLSFTMPKHIAVAIAGGALAIALGTAVIFLGKGTENDPANILPADQTLALVRNANQQSMLALQAYVPGFDSIALPEHPVDVALLSLANGSSAWAIFDTSTAPIGTRFSISASEASVQGMIGAGENRLSEDASYKDLKPFMDNGPAAYLRFPALSLKPSTTVGSLFAPKKPVAVLFGADATRVVLPEGELPEALSSSLSPATATVLESKIRTLAAAFFGTEVSPAYDILPFLRTSGLLEMRNGKDIVLAGEGGSDVQATVRRLHDFFAAGQPGVEVVNLPLDDQFSYTGIRKSDASVRKTTEYRNGFEVTKSSGDGALFLSATRGSSVVLSNAEEGLAAGMAALDAAGNSFAFRADAPSVEGLLPSVGNASVLWTATRDNGRFILEIPG